MVEAIQVNEPRYREALSRVAEVVIHETGEGHYPIEVGVNRAETSTGKPTWAGYIRFRYFDGRGADQVWSFTIDDDGTSTLHCVDTATGEQHF